MAAEGADGMSSGIYSNAADEDEEESDEEFDRVAFDDDDNAAPWR